MKIALFSTCAVPTPPRAYGGIERFVATLADGLVARRHEVVVYATADSRPAARLRHRFATPVWPPNPVAEREHARFAWADLSSFEPDVVHVNGGEALACGANASVPVVATIHDAPWPALVQIHASAGAHCVAISRHQARSLAGITRLTVIPHGLDVDAYPAGRGKGGYVVFLGRIGPEKAPHLAIDAALKAGVRLRIGGPYWPGVARYERYFADQFAPRLAAARGLAEWLGELDLHAKLALLGNAQALLFPLAWEEPFGLVMIEAMLAGTPVVAFARGSPPEIVDEGVTGLVVRDVDEMAAAIERAARLDRRRCRARARERFDARTMVSRYEALYRALQKSNIGAAAAA